MFLMSSIILNDFSQNHFCADVTINYKCPPSTVSQNAKPFIYMSLTQETTLVCKTGADLS